MTTTPFLSKSKYLLGLQCPKLLWYHYNAKDEIPQISADTQAIFEQGHLVGAYAKRLYPGGIEVAEGIYDYERVTAETQALIARRAPLFEPAFRYKNVYARADILNPVGTDAWELIEVKSSTDVKDINLHDLALQWYAYDGAGLRIERCFLLHINRDYVRHGDIDVQKLFVREDVTAQVKKLLPTVEANVDEMIATIGAPSCPAVPIGLCCYDPYPCVLQEQCFAFLPRHNPLTLQSIRKKKAFALIESGMSDLTELDDGVSLTARQKIQIKSLRTQKEFIDKRTIRSFLNALVYPLYFLDFESICPAIPLYDNSSPYQQIPFQFSLHVQSSPGAAPDLFGSLADGRDDPRVQFLSLLRSHLGDKGSIVSYNASFEKNILKQTCEVYPAYRAWNKTVQRRFVDLLKPFQAFSYYHYAQLGSASIKSVLPVLTGHGYEDMPIAEGGMASREFMRITHGQDIPPAERESVRKNLEEYCKLDTMAMIKIIDKLREMSE